MSKNKEYIFSSPGCLSLEAILRYLRDESTFQERHNVEKHTLECELCKEALDGYALMEEKNKAAGIVSDLNKGFAKKTASIFYVRRIAAGVAAVLVFGGGLYYLSTSIDSVNKTVAIQREESHSVTSKGKSSEEIQMEENGAIVPEYSKPKMKKRGNENSKSHTYNSNKEIVIDHKASESYFSENGTQISSAARVLTEEETNEQAGIAADTISLKDQIAYEYAKPAAVVSESDKKVLIEKGINEGRKQEDMAKSKSRYANTARSTEKMGDSELAEVKSDVLNVGIQFYKEKKYVEASGVFESIIKSDSSNFKALYYNGLSYFESENWNKAIGNFSLIKKGKEFYEEARWNMAMALTKKGNKDRAREIFEEMAGREGPYKQKAMEELRKLER